MHSLKILLYSVLFIAIITLFTNNRAYSGDSDFYKKNIPLPVIQYADRRFDYTNNPEVHLRKQKNWKGYKVYHLVFDWCNCAVCGEPQYILYKKNDIRMADYTERTTIYFMNKQKNTEKSPVTSIHEAWKLYCKNK